MSASSRHDLLVDVLLHMGEKVIENAPSMLARRAKMATVHMKVATDTLSNLCETVQGWLSYDIVLNLLSGYSFYILLFKFLCIAI